MRPLLFKGKMMNGKKYFGIAQDITTQKESEQSLQVSEQQFRLLAENSEDIISIHALNGTTWYLSPSVRTVLGYQVEEIISRSFIEFVHPEDRKNFDALKKIAVLPEEESLTISYRVEKKDHSYIWLESIIKPVRDDASVVRLICTS